MGDGFMASFPSVPQALRSAVGIQRELEEHNRTDVKHPLRVRIGVHTGDVTARAGPLYGGAVNAASRIAAHAAGGEIFASVEVREAADPAERDAGDAQVWRDRGQF